VIFESGITAAAITAVLLNFVFNILGGERTTAPASAGLPATSGVRADG
jgi:xanthine/uracil permease